MAKRLSPVLARRLREIKVVAMDVDGVLTAGEIIILSSGDLKIWNVKDRLAFAMLKNAGSPFKIAWITGRSSEDVRLRASEIGVDALFEKCADKKAAFSELSERWRAKPREILCIGDDLVDIPMLKPAGIAACPSDAHPEVKKICDLILGAPGGKGAFRELAEILLKTRDLWKKSIAPYL